MNGDGELNLWVKSLDERVKAIEKKLDKVSMKVAMIVGGITVLAFFANKILS